MTIPQAPSDYHEMYCILAGIFLGYALAVVAFIIAHWLHGRDKP